MSTKKKRRHRISIIKKSDIRRFYNTLIDGDYLRITTYTPQNKEENRLYVGFHVAESLRIELKVKKKRETEENRRLSTLIFSFKIVKRNRGTEKTIPRGFYSLMSKLRSPFFCHSAEKAIFLPQPLAKASGVWYTYIKRCGDGMSGSVCIYQTI